jgi:hypothetical protein
MYWQRRALKTLMLEAGRDYDPVKETMFNTPADAPLAGVGRQVCGLTAKRAEGGGRAEMDRRVRVVASSQCY